MVEQSFRAMIEFALKQDANMATINRAFARAVRSVRRAPYRLAEAVRFQVLVQISEILGAWHREPAYLDETGSPRPLTLLGIKSFGALVKRFVPALDPNDIADILVEEGVLARNQDHTLLPLRRVAGFLTPNALMLDRVPALLHGMLGTLTHNTEPNRTRDTTRCEHGTTVSLPTEEIDPFNREVKRAMKEFLDSLDEWAERRREARPDATNLTQAGVEVFFYVDDLIALKKTGTS